MEALEAISVIDAVVEPVESVTALLPIGTEQRDTPSQEDEEPIHSTTTHVPGEADLLLTLRPHSAKTHWSPLSSTQLR